MISFIHYVSWLQHAAQNVPNDKRKTHLDVERKVLDRKIEDVCMRLDVPRTAVLPTVDFCVLKGDGWDFCIEMNTHYGSSWVIFQHHVFAQLAFLPTNINDLKFSHLPKPPLKCELKELMKHTIVRHRGCFYWRFDEGSNAPWPPRSSQINRWIHGHGPCLNLRERYILSKITTAEYWIWNRRWVSESIAGISWPVKKGLNWLCWGI